MAQLARTRKGVAETMLTRVGTITVQVRDQDQALAYYTEKLGFETRMDVPMGPEQRWIEVAPAGAQTRILLYKATPDQPGADSYEAAKARIGPSPGMVLEVDDIAAPSPNCASVASQSSRSH